MAMGIVSDSDFTAELENTSKSGNAKPPSVTNIPPAIIPNSQTPQIIDLPTKGRGKDNVEVPNGLRNVIGQTAIESGRKEALELAQQFGISPSSVSAYTNGATSTATINDRPNASTIGEVKERIAKRARTKLMAAIHHLTPEKLEAAKARDLAGIAKDMSAVVKSMEETDPSKQNGNNGPTFVFYSPQFRTEDAFEAVYTKE